MVCGNKTLECLEHSLTLGQHIPQDRLMINRNKQNCKYLLLHDKMLLGAPLLDDPNNKTLVCLV